MAFAAEAQSVMLTGSEYAEACKEYPIIFIKTPDAGVMSVALLGFRQSENLFVDASGNWSSRYIPAYVRRYPFIISEIGPDQLVVCVDADCTGLNVAGEGERLFDEQGEATPYVNGMIQFMQDYQADFLRTKAFLDNLLQLDLLTESNAKIILKSGEEHLINGIWLIDESKLAALPDDKLLMLARSGELGRIYAHLMSLSNLNQFSVRETQRAAAV